MENKISADERGNQTQLLFSSVGNAASRSVVITVGLGIPRPPGWEKKSGWDHSFWVGEQNFVGDATWDQNAHM